LLYDKITQRKKSILAVQIPEEFTVVVLEVGGIAHLGALLKGKGAKKIKGAMGGKTTKRENAQPLYH